MKKEAGKPKGSEGKGEVFGSSSSDKPTASIAVKRKASGGDASSKKLAADGKSSVAANWAFAVCFKWAKFSPFSIELYVSSDQTCMYTIWWKE